MSKAELAADLGSKEDMRSTGIYKLLAEQTVETFGGKPWTVLAGNYIFDNSHEDAELLGRIWGQTLIIIIKLNKVKKTL